MASKPSTPGPWTLGAALALAAACSGPAVDSRQPAFVPPTLAGPTPWNGRDFDTPEGSFTFAVFADLAGQERAGVFDVAVAQLELLRPAFVMSLGDLIEGESEDSAGLNREWDAFEAQVSRLPAPLFRMGGNHDLTSQATREVWTQRFGPHYYHFTYKDVLFLVLDTEDYTDQRRSEIHQARREALEFLYGGHPEVATQMEYYRMPERNTGEIGPDQSRYFQNVIANHPQVRWTVIFTHKPVWRRDDEPDWTAVETALGDRPYTVFTGHVHTFSHTVKNGRDHFTLATTGGSQGARDPMAFDQLTLVAMTREGPSIAHLRLDGILDATGHIPLGGDTLCFQASRCGGGEW